jgi:hypothetical protein
MTVRNKCRAGSGACKLGGIALSGLLGTTFLCGTAIPALADAGSEDTLDLSDLQRISDGSMQKLRGGFNIGGFDLSFGVTVTTTVNGATVLQTSFNVNDPGQISNIKTSVAQNAASGAPANAGSNTVEGVTVKGANPVSVNVDVDVKVNVDAVHQAVNAVNNKGTGGTANAGTTTTTTLPTAETADATPGFQGTSTPLPSTVAAGVTNASADTQGGGANDDLQSGSSTNDTSSWTVSQLSDGSGIKMTSADLATTIIQRFGSGVSTDITNTANDRTFTNTTDMSLFLNNFAQISAQASASRMLTSLANEMMANHTTIGN